MATATQPIIKKDGAVISSCDIGDTVVITLEAESSSYDHDLYYGIAGQTISLAEYVVGPYTWEIPLSMCEYLPNTTEGKLTIRCETYEGYSLIGSKTTSITVYVPTTVIPTITDFTYSEAVSGISDTFGGYVKDNSKLNVTIAGSGMYGSSIVQYSAEILDKTYTGTSFTTDILDKSGTFTIKARIVDSRGRDAVVFKSITILDYSPPIVSKLKAYRCTSSGVASDEGAYIRVEYEFTVDEMDGNNTTSYSIASSIAEEDNYTTLMSSASYAVSDYYISTTEHLIEYPYTVRLRVTDYFKSYDFYVDIATAFVPMDINANGRAFAFGKASEKTIGIEFNLPLYDQYDTRILNGLAFYESGGTTDANTTIEELFITSTNSPDGGLWNIRQIFYSDKSATANRTQYAIPYVYGSADSSVYKSHYRRHYRSGAWSDWIEIPVLIGEGTSGIWTYRKWSNGKAECFGKIPISSLAVTTALGTWYRSAPPYTGSDYPYPFTFSEIPNVTAQYATNNGTGGLVWLNDQGTTSTPPTCYLIRPTSSSGITGAINIQVEGTY
jgi:hypothetical protein